MTPEQLAEIRARAEAATPGPWSWVGAATSTGWEDAEELAHPEGIIATADGGYWFEPPNSDFVAHARTDIPALLDYIEELEARLPLRIEALENALAAVNALRGVEPTNA